MIKEFELLQVVCNGDALDGANLSGTKAVKIGIKPSVEEELDASGYSLRRN